MTYLEFPTRGFVVFLLVAAVLALAPNIYLEYQHPSGHRWVSDGESTTSDSWTVDILNGSGYLLAMPYKLFSLAVESLNEAPFDVYHYYEEYNQFLLQTGSVYFSLSSREYAYYGDYLLIDNPYDVTSTVAITFTFYIDIGHIEYFFDWQEVCEDSALPFAWMLGGGGIMGLLFIELTPIVEEVD